MEIRTMRSMPACLNMGYAGIHMYRAVLIYRHGENSSQHPVTGAPDETTCGIPVGKGPSV